MLSLCAFLSQDFNPDEQRMSVLAPGPARKELLRALCALYAAFKRDHMVGGTLCGGGTGRGIRTRAWTRLPPLLHWQFLAFIPAQYLVRLYCRCVPRATRVVYDSDVRAAAGRKSTRR